MGKISINSDLLDIYVKKSDYIELETELQRAKAELKAENERLKGSLKISQGLCKTLEKAKSNEHEQWFNRCCEINTERDKYRQALKEIRDIAEKMYNTNDEDVERDFYIKLQAKINEVIGAEQIG